MNSKELEEVLRDFQKQLLIGSDGQTPVSFYELSTDDQIFYYALQDFINILRERNKHMEPVLVIERCLFCGQIIPQRKKVNKK